MPAGSLPLSGYPTAIRRWAPTWTQAPSEGGVRGLRGTLCRQTRATTDGDRQWRATGLTSGWHLEDGSLQRGGDVPSKLPREGGRRSVVVVRLPIITIYPWCLRIREAELNHPWWRAGVRQRCLSLQRGRCRSKTGAQTLEHPLLDS
jgi:hypothetical protein